VLGTELSCSTQCYPTSWSVLPYGEWALFPVVAILMAMVWQVTASCLDFEMSLLVYT
jgi:hypothetical protein